MSTTGIPHYPVLTSLPHGNGKVEDALDLPGIRIEDRGTRYCLVIPANMLDDMEKAKDLFQLLDQAGYLSLPKDRLTKYLKNLLRHELPRHIQLDDAQHGFLNIHSLDKQVEFTITKSPVDRTLKPKEEAVPPQAKPTPAPQPPVAPAEPAEEPSPEEQAPPAQVTPAQAAAPSTVVAGSDKEHEKGLGTLSPAQPSRLQPAAEAKPAHQVAAYILAPITATTFPNVKSTHTSCTDGSITVKLCLREIGADYRNIREYVNSAIKPYDPNVVFRSKVVTVTNYRKSDSAQMILIETTRPERFLNKLEAANPDWRTDDVKTKLVAIQKEATKDNTMVNRF